jgi:hypothetical protein
LEKQHAFGGEVYGHWNCARAYFHSLDEQSTKGVLDMVAFVPTWENLYAEKQGLAQNGPEQLRAHYAAEVKVMTPTMMLLRGDVGTTPPLPVEAQVDPQTVETPDGVAGRPKPTKGSPKTPAGYEPVSGDDTQGHVVGHIVATDPGKYDQFINEACEFYGGLYGVKIDPDLVKAHIWQESKGDPFALSQDGQLSRGLMQVSNSSGVPTATIIGQVVTPDGSPDPKIGVGGGNQYDPRTSIFTGVKYMALAMSGKMGEMLEKSGLPPSELGNFPNRPLTQLEAMRAYQGGPGVLTNPTDASRVYGEQLTGLQAQFAAGKAPSDLGYINPRSGAREPSYGTLV